MIRKQTTNDRLFTTVHRLFHQPRAVRPGPVRQQHNTSEVMFLKTFAQKNYTNKTDGKFPGCSWTTGHSCPHWVFPQETIRTFQPPSLYLQTSQGLLYLRTSTGGETDHRRRTVVFRKAIKRLQATWFEMRCFYGQNLFHLHPTTQFSYVCL